MTMWPRVEIRSCRPRPGTPVGVFVLKFISKYFYQKIKRRSQSSITEATIGAVASRESDPIDLLRPAKVAADSECSISSIMVLLEPRTEHRMVKNPHFSKNHNLCRPEESDWITTRARHLRRRFLQ